jgi:V8-like Glu-specific endopeptidase
MKTIIFFLGSFVLFSNLSLATCNPNGATPQIDLTETGLNGALDLDSFLKKADKREYTNKGDNKVLVTNENFPKNKGIVKIHRKGSVAHCTGVMISPKHILTAGHCINYGGLVGDLLVETGSNSGGKVKNVSFNSNEVKKYRDFKYEKMYPEFAVIELEEEVPGVPIFELLPKELNDPKKISEYVFVAYHGDHAPKNAANLTSGQGGRFQTMQTSKMITAMDIDEDEWQEYVEEGEEYAWDSVELAQEFFTYGGGSGGPILYRHKGTGKLYIGGITTQVASSGGAADTLFTHIDVFRDIVQDFISQ